MTQTKKNKKSFLERYLKSSSMRLSLFVVLILSAVLVMAIAAHIVISTYRDSIIDWSGLAIFMGGISAFIGVAVTGKWASKKVERKGNE